MALEMKGCSLQGMQKLEIGNIIKEFRQLQSPSATYDPPPPPQILTLSFPGLQNSPFHFVTIRGVVEFFYKPYSFFVLFGVSKFSFYIFRTNLLLQKKLQIISSQTFVDKGVVPKVHQ